MAHPAPVESDCIMTMWSLGLSARSPELFTITTRGDGDFTSCILQETNRSASLNTVHRLKNNNQDSTARFPIGETNSLNVISYGGYCIPKNHGLPLWPRVA